eukprot:symbB.v1.2.008535.t1/scaffold538.1/size242405/2
MAANLARALPLQRLCRRTGWRTVQLRSFSLLEQLPDYASGSKALAEGRFSEALPMLQRSVEAGRVKPQAIFGIPLHAGGRCLFPS